MNPTESGYYWYRSDQPNDPASSGEWEVVYVDIERDSVHVADMSFPIDYFRGSFEGPLKPPSNGLALGIPKPGFIQVLYFESEHEIGVSHASTPMVPTTSVERGFKDHEYAKAAFAILKEALDDAPEAPYFSKRIKRP